MRTVHDERSVGRDGVEGGRVGGHDQPPLELLQLLCTLVGALVLIDLRHHRLDLCERLSDRPVVRVRPLGHLQQFLSGVSRMAMSGERRYVPGAGEGIYIGAELAG